MTRNEGEMPPGRLIPSRANTLGWCGIRLGAQRLGFDPLSGGSTRSSANPPAASSEGTFMLNSPTGKLHGLIQPVRTTIRDAFGWGGRATIRSTLAPLGAALIACTALIYDAVTPQ